MPYILVHCFTVSLESQGATATDMVEVDGVSNIFRGAASQSPRRRV